MEHLMRIFLFHVLAVLLLSGSLPGQAWKGDLHPDLPKLKQQAEAGDPAAMAEYAFHSMRCMGGLRFQPHLIFRYFSKSAEAGHEEGKVGLAHCYCFNVGTVRDLEKAHSLIEEPLKNNHPVAQKIMGFFYYGSQDFMPLDSEKIAEFTRKSADQGCVAARYNLALSFIKGHPVKDVEQGMNELREMHEKRLFPMASGYLLHAMEKHRIWPDHEEVFRSCVQRITEYAELNEPYSLYRLGIFHQRAGDFENAVVRYTRAAQVGSGEAWLMLWKMANYGERGEQGNLWTSPQSREVMALRAYERGYHTNRSLADAGYELTRRLGSKAYQARFPQLEKDLLKGLPKDCHLHDILGRLYIRASQETNADLWKPEWAIAHLVAHSHHGTNATDELARIYLNAAPKTELLARGYAAAVFSRECPHSSYHGPKRWQQTQDKMTPEAVARAEELLADDYPAGEKHRAEAINRLIELGHLPPAQELE